MGFQVPNSPTPRAPAHLGTCNSKGFWIPTLQLCKSTPCALVDLELKGPLNSKSPTPQLPARLRTWGLGTQRATGFQLCNFASPPLLSWSWNLKGRLIPSPQLPNSPRACALGDLELKGLLDSNFATLQVPTVLLWSWNLKGRLIPSPQLPNSPTPSAPAHLGTWNSKGYWIPTLQVPPLWSCGFRT